MEDDLSPHVSMATSLCYSSWVHISPLPSTSSPPVIQPSLSVLCGPSLSHFSHCCSSKENLTHKPGLDQTQPGQQDFIVIMSEVSQLPPLPLWSNSNASSTPFAPVTPSLPREETAMQAHTIVIVVIFCGVCLLLLLAFLYTFCLHCSIRTPPRDVQMANGCSLDREDATYKCSSSECQSVANIV